MVRIKHRYLLLNILYSDTKPSKNVRDATDFLKFHAPTPQHVNSQTLIAHLRTHIAALFGDQGLGLCLSSLKLVYFSNATSTAIIRVPRAHYQIVWTTLCYMTELPVSRGQKSMGVKCVMRVVHVSGTIRKAEEELLRRSRMQLAHAKSAGPSAQEALLTRIAASGETDLVVSSPNDQHAEPMLESGPSMSESE